MKHHRKSWLQMLDRLARPVLEAGAEGRLRETLPQQGPKHRSPFAHLEAIARLLTGLAPWLETEGGPPEETEARRELTDKARCCISHLVDPHSPDRASFRAENGGQPLVEAAFLGQALLRAPKALKDGLSSDTRSLLTQALLDSRSILPPANNWLLFSAMVEAALQLLAEEADLLRVDAALRQHEQWYKGDGSYGDGPELHHDYYNSFVIHPMLLELTDAFGERIPYWAERRQVLLDRARRHAAVLERLIAPDGSFPPLGRSLSYRSGAFHHLALMALRQELPAELSPGAVRAALSAVLGRTLEAPETFDEKGFLQIGLCGHQPTLGEGYISTGSLYLCSTAFLPLGLPPKAAFWSDPATDWTARRLWAGADLPPDKAN